MKLFVDTNVLLDHIAARQPFAREAAHIWALSESDRVHGYVSAISFNNVWYIVRKAAGRKEADRAVRLIRDVFHTVALGERLLNRAIDAGFDDFEDAIQFHAAAQVKAQYLVTRDPGDFPDTGPAILTPAEFLGIVRQ
ncbi:MAG: type II toxin-antitoxin system VapC family toxin [Planctomycetota bacterium]